MDGDDLVLNDLTGFCVRSLRRSNHGEFTKPKNRMSGNGRGSQAEHQRWGLFERFRVRRLNGKDTLVREWKQAWNKGAQARWSGKPFTNPHPAGSPRAAAWTAGWQWAERQPDRRQPTVVRFAHPLRRNTDTTARLARTAQAGAVGLSVVTLVGWMWQMRRRRVS